MDGLKINIIDSTIDLCIMCNPTDLETNTRDTEQTVDADAIINLGGASSDSGIYNSTTNDVTNNADANNDATINKSKDATAALKLFCLHSVISAITKIRCLCCVPYMFEER